jgi:hypothetical protein
VKNTTITRFAVAVFASITTLSAAYAGPTVVRTAPASELGAAGILSHVYGGSFSASANGFTNGSITATRVNDDSASGAFLAALGPSGGDVNDSIWTGSRFEARTLAKFSLNSQSFGTLAGESGGLFESLLDASGFGVDVSGAGSIDLTGQTFRWGRSGSTGTHSSLDSDNLDGRDHLVTYRIDGLGDLNESVWALFWEDLDKTATVGKYRSYADYNDLVVELRGLAPDATPVPLPPAIVPGLAILGVMAYRRRRNANA